MLSPVFIILSSTFFRSILPFQTPVRGCAVTQENDNRIEQKNKSKWEVFKLIEPWFLQAFQKYGFTSLRFVKSPGYILA